MAEKLFDAENFLSDAERRAIRLARELYRDYPTLSVKLAEMVREIRDAKKEVVSAVLSTAA